MQYSVSPGTTVRLLKTVGSVEKGCSATVLRVVTVDEYETPVDFFILEHLGHEVVALRRDIEVLATYVPRGRRVPQS